MGKRASPRESGGASGFFAFELHSTEVNAPPDLVAYTREKLTAKLAKFERRILEVVVRLRDLNGPKGGDSFACHMEALLPHLEPVNVEERDHDLRAAIDRTVDRLDVAVQRHVERERSLRRNRGRKLVRHVKLAP